VEDEIERETADDSETADSRRQMAADANVENNVPPSLESEGQKESPLADLLPSSQPIYILVNADNSLTISSADTAALNRLESLLKKINSGIVYEGRDFTIFSVRNVSAQDVASRVLTIMQAQMATQPARAAFGTAPVPMSMTPEIRSNTVYVRGSRFVRQEAGKLIAMFDVSELPGEQVVRKPISVPLKNAPVSRVLNQIQRVYQQKIAMTRLPGGVVPQVFADPLKGSLEIIAPEPLATELKEYAEEIDRLALEEPGRKIHVIPLKVKATVIQRALMETESLLMQTMSYGGYGMPMMIQPYNYNMMQQARPFAGFSGR
jgi:hypothetical protein